MTTDIARLPTRRSVRVPKPPATLGESGRRTWTAVHRDYVISDGHHREILLTACLAADRADQARREIEQRGLLIDGRFGLKANPAAAIEQAAKVLQLRALRELGLDLDSAPDTRPAYHVGGRR